MRKKPPSEIRIPAHLTAPAAIDGCVQAGSLTPVLGALVEELRSSGREEQAIEILALGWPPRPEGPIEVDLARMIVRWGRVVWDCESEDALRILQVLTNKRGHWITAAELRQHDRLLEGVRPHKVMRHLPQAIRRLIETSKNPRKGMRLRDRPM